jgi:hypothetical protein
LAKLQCYCVIGAHPSLFGNPEAAGDSIIPTPASEQNEGIDKLRAAFSVDPSPA